MEQKLNWKTWLARGDQYMRAVSPQGKASRFNAAIKYNLLSMSLESYIMAVLDHRRSLPQNHTYTDLISALERVVPLEHGLKQRILKYENIQSICSVDKYHITDPTETELADLTTAVQAIGELAKAAIPESVS